MTPGIGDFFRVISAQPFCAFCARAICASALGGKGGISTSHAHLASGNSIRHCAREPCTHVGVNVFPYLSSLYSLQVRGGLYSRRLDYGKDD